MPECKAKKTMTDVIRETRHKTKMETESELELRTGVVSFESIIDTLGSADHADWLKRDLCTKLQYIEFGKDRLKQLSRIERKEAEAFSKMAKIVDNHTKKMTKLTDRDQRTLSNTEFRQWSETFNGSVVNNVAVVRSHIQDLKESAADKADYLKRCSAGINVDNLSSVLRRALQANDEYLSWRDKFIKSRQNLSYVQRKYNKLMDKSPRSETGERHLERVRKAKEHAERKMLECNEAMQSSLEFYKMQCELTASTFDRQTEVTSDVIMRVSDNFPCPSSHFPLNIKGFTGLKTDAFSEPCLRPSMEDTINLLQARSKTACMMLNLDESSKPSDVSGYLTNTIMPSSGETLIEYTAIQGLGPSDLAERDDNVVEEHEFSDSAAESKVTVDDKDCGLLNAFYSS